MSLEVAELRAELAALRAEVAGLSVVVARQGETLRELQYLASFEVVEPEEKGTTAPAPLHSGEGRNEDRADSSVSAEPSDWTHRIQVAKEIGQFLRAGLEGRTISSGRSKVTLKNNIYILARDKDGKDFRPARVFRSWRGIRPFVEFQGRTEGRLGASVFIGLPSQREAVVAVTEAGLEWPSQIEP